MLGGSRDARRTERYLDGLLDAEERGAPDAPMDLDLDPSVLLAARELRAGLVRVHPSFRFEEGLASRLAQQAARMAQAGPDGRLPVAAPASIARFVIPGAGVAMAGDVLVGQPARRLMAARPSRPLVVGGVGVASALSIGAVFVAWRWSRNSQLPMVRAARAARTGRGHSSGTGRRAAVLHGILGVMS
jgi:hypothetical protein